MSVRKTDITKLFSAVCLCFLYSGCESITATVPLLGGSAPLSNSDTTAAGGSSTGKPNLGPPVVSFAALSPSGLSLFGKELQNVTTMKLIDPTLPTSSNVVATFTNIKPNASGTSLSANAVAAGAAPTLSLVAGVVYQLMVSNAYSSTFSNIVISTIGGPVTISGGFLNAMGIGNAALPSSTSPGQQGILFTDAPGFPWIGADNTSGNLIFRAGGTQTSPSGTMTFSPSGTLYVSGKVGVGISTPSTNLNIHNDYTAGSWASMFTTNPFNSQVVVGSMSQRLYLGAYYLSGQGSAGVIQASDYYSNADHPQSLLLNPIGGSVGIGTTSPIFPLEVKRPSAAGTVASFGDSASSGRYLRLTTNQGGGATSLGILNGGQYWDFGVGLSGQAFISPGGSTGIVLTPVGVSGGSGANLSVAGTITTTAITGLPNSIGANGYQTLPGGMILQWGFGSSCGSSCNSTVTFPIAFPNNAFSVTLTSTNGGSYPVGGAMIVSKSTSGFSVDAATSTSSKPGFYWMAIGN